MRNLDTIRAILPDLGQMEEVVSRQQYQRPPLQERRGSWIIRVRVPELDPDTGKFERVQKRIILGRVDEMTRTAAAKKADKILETINDGRYVASAQLEFAGVVAKYQEAKLPMLGARTQEKYRAHIRNHILPAFGLKRLAEIDVAAIEAWLASKRKTYADATRADMLHCLSAIFSAAIKWRYWGGENPCQAVELGAIAPKREKRLLTADETQRFFACLPETKVCTPETARFVAMTAVIAGLRVSEILGLQWQDLDRGKQRINVRRRAGRGEVATTKSKASRRDPKIGALIDELLRLKPADAPEDGWIFSRDGEPLDDRDLQQHVYRPAAELAKIYAEGFGMHWFRAMNITLRQHAGASAIEAAKAAGHSRPGVTALYTMLDDSRESDQVKYIANYVGLSKSGPKEPAN